jgi:hypothetical protein
MHAIILCALGNLYHYTLTTFDFQIQTIQGEEINIYTNYFLNYFLPSYQNDLTMHFYDLQ